MGSMMLLFKAKAFAPNRNAIAINKCFYATFIVILWPPDAKNWLSGKDPDAGKDWGPEKGVTEDETAGWHHRLDGQ